MKKLLKFLERKEVELFQHCGMGLDQNEQYRATINATLNRMAVLESELRQKRFDEWLPVEGMDKHDVADRILSIVCECTGITREQIASKSRKRKIVNARKFLTAAIMEFFAGKAEKERVSLAAIGKIQGGRDHSSIIHQRDALYNEIQFDREFRQQYNRVGEAISKAFTPPSNDWEDVV
jgi:chromosomal replication initiation ATPase DnaA